MNSMNKIVEDLKTKIEILNIEYPLNGQFAVDLKNDDVMTVLMFLKNRGFTQLSLLTCVDFIKENEFQLTYILFNWDNAIQVQIRTRLPRENVQFESVLPIFPGAEYYERDVHEFFGIKFIGNKNADKQLFLELWDDLPPMRKDFDPQAFADKTFPKMEYDKRFISKVGGIDNE